MYVWIKAFHIISVIAWMAALLYLPRLFVYHASAAVGGETSETFKIMERRLLKAIARPAMIATWVLGLTLMYMSAAWNEGWFHAKFLLVVGLSAYHGWLARTVGVFATDQNRRTPTYYRVANEVPTLALIVIIILVVVKPI